MAEFLLLQQKPGQASVIWVVEAKSCSPRPETKPDFTTFINEVRAKLINGFLLCIAALLQRHPAAADELPDSFKALDLKSLDFRFILVVKEHKEEWLAPLRDALLRTLNPIIKIWALSAIPVIVLNDKLAQRCGLIPEQSSSGESRGLGK